MINFAISFLAELREDLDFRRFRHLPENMFTTNSSLKKCGISFLFLFFFYFHIFECTYITKKSRQALDAIQTHYQK